MNGYEMRIGSLFSGIGGFDLAMEAAGHEIIWQIENDPFCRKVLRHHWPDVNLKGDIRERDFTRAPQIDGIIGGFPCQPFSVAGKMKNTDDPRNMWPETIRAIKETNARFAFLENVPGLLYPRSEGYFLRILEDLAEAGFDAEWGTYRASDIGAPHRRERLFILAYRDAGLDFIPNEEVRARWFALDYEGRDVAHTDLQLSDVQQWAAWTKPNRGFNSFPPAPDDLEGWAYVLSKMSSLEPALCRVDDGVPDRTHRLKALGNAVVWPQAALAFEELRRRIP